jgi:hypothetical protein
LVAVVPVLRTQVRQQQMEQTLFFLQLLHRAAVAAQIYKPPIQAVAVVVVFIIYLTRLEIQEVTHLLKDQVAVLVEQVAVALIREILTHRAVAVVPHKLAQMPLSPVQVKAEMVQHLQYQVLQ